MNEPLDVRCHDCNGAGYVMHPEWEEWWRRNWKAWEVAETEEELEELQKSQPDVEEEIVCGVCHGAGRVPTELGQLLIDFLVRHGFERKLV